MKKLIILLLLIIPFVYSGANIIDITSTNTTINSTRISWSCNPYVNSTLFNVTDADDFYMRHRRGDDNYAQDSEHIDVGRDNSSADLVYKGLNHWNLTPYLNRNVSAWLYIFYEVDFSTTQDLNVLAYSNYSWNYVLSNCNSGVETQHCFNNLTGGNLLVNWTNISAYPVRSFRSFNITSDIQGAIDAKDAMYNVMYTSRYDDDYTAYGDTRQVRLGDYTHLNDPFDPTDSNRLILDNITICNFTIRLYNDSSRDDSSLVTTISNKTFDEQHELILSSLDSSTTYYLNISSFIDKEDFVSNNTHTFATLAAPVVSQPNATSTQIATGKAVSAFALMASLMALVIIIVVGIFATIAIRTQSFDMDSFVNMLLILLVAFVAIAIFVIIVTAFGDAG